MINIQLTSSFKRAFKKKIKPNTSRTEKFWQVVEKFQTDPYHPQLKTHKLSGKLKDLLSFSVEYDLRVIFYFSDEENAVFVDIGNHDEVY